MTVIAIVGGVKLYMHANDHPAAHFHALFGEYRAAIDIETVAVSRGQLPRVKRAAVLEWARARRAELADAWNATQAGLLVDRIQ